MVARKLKRFEAALLKINRLLSCSRRYNDNKVAGSFCRRALYSRRKLSEAEKLANRQKRTDCDEFFEAQKQIVEDVVTKCAGNLKDAYPRHSVKHYIAELLQ